MRIATRFTLAFLGTLLLVLAGQALLRVQTEQEVLERDMARDNRRLGEGLAAGLGELWEEGGEHAARRLVERVELGLITVRLRSVKAPLDDPSLKQKERRNHLLTRVPVLDRGVHVAWLELKEPLPPERPLLTRALNSFAAAGASTALLYAAVAMLLGWLLIGRPARELVTKTERMAAGDLAPDLVVTRPDELGQLAAAVNVLCQRLNEAGVRLGEAERKRLSAEAEALRAAAERDDAVAQLLHADRLSTIGRLAASLAHELGSPLTVIAGRAQSIARGRTQGEAKVQESAQIVAEQAQRVGDLIRQLLDFSRRQPSERQVIDLSALVVDWADVLRPLAKRHNVELVVETQDAGASSALGYGDPALIQQVVTNLVVNAIHAQPDGGRVLVSVKRDAFGCELVVADEGPGIPPDVRVHIFEPFFTTKKVGEGTGLGLSVVQEIVTSHGGEIEVETPAGGGAAFRVRLPGADAEEEAA